MVQYRVTQFNHGDPMKSLALLVVLTILSSMAFAGTYTTKDGSYNIECNSTRTVQLWLSRHTVWKASNVCWLCFSGGAPLDVVNASVATLPKALRAYAETIAPVGVSKETVRKCANTSLGNISRSIRQSSYEDPVLVNDYYQEALSVLTPCVCKE